MTVIGLGLMGQARDAAAWSGEHGAHLLHESAVQGVDMERAIAAGHGTNSYAAMLELFRKP
ncbi:hypothetical protein [Nocardia bhagyanarayanae]|uniref:hypothetical protein n=1 Tax=Nocardia bhagyanarayanae TaxID=1215925 RepID=UPI00163B5F27|nr:hypothetical protein [Nocardia bhagyanarayanae]